MEYDLAGQLSSVTIRTNGVGGTVIKRYAFTFDKAGNRIGPQIDDIPNQGTINNLNQLSSVSSAGPTRFAGWINETGTVKVAGIPAIMISLTNFTGAANLSLGTNVVPVVAFDSQNNYASNRYQVVITNGLPATLQYDANGNLTNQYTSTYTNRYDWDGEDRLIRITRRSTGDPVEYKTEFLYDGLGRRVQIVERTNDVVASSPRYLWCGTQICQRRGSGGGTPDRFYVDYGEYHNPGLYHYTFDHLGSIREVHGGQQGLIARYDYDPYGRKTVISENTDIAFGYTGHFHHPGSGLHLAMFRALDSGTGRWLSRDPIEEAGGLNYYAYAENDPVGLYDPLGLRMASPPSPAAVRAVGNAMRGIPIRPGGATAPAWAFAAGWALGTLLGDITGLSAGVQQGWEIILSNYYQTQPSLSGPPRKPPCPPKAPAGFPGDEQENHHRLPKEFKEWFEAPPRNLNIEDYVTKMPMQWHRGQQIGLHNVRTADGLRYNKAWDQFIGKNPDASAKQVLEFLQKLEGSLGF